MGRMKEISVAIENARKNGVGEFDLFDDEQGVEIEYVVLKKSTYNNNLELEKAMSKPYYEEVCLSVLH